jgi:6-pyruvoyl-tetrahydropterin synthase
MIHRYLSLSRPFVADHFHDLPGFVEARHGHNWDVEATFAIGGAEDEPGCAKALDAWVEGIDYTLLNSQDRLRGRNPTTELLAQWLFLYLEERQLQVVNVRVREKANYWAACSRDAQ